jgi:hypothetical protein
MTVAATIDNLTMASAHGGASQAARSSPGMTRDNSGMGLAPAQASDTLASWQSILAGLGINKESIDTQSADDSQSAAAASSSANIATESATTTTDPVGATSQSVIANRTLPGVGLASGKDQFTSRATQSDATESALSARVSSSDKKSKPEKETTVTDTTQGPVAASQFTTVQIERNLEIARTDCSSIGDGGQSTPQSERALRDASGESGANTIAAIGMDPLSGVSTVRSSAGSKTSAAGSASSFAEMMASDAHQVEQNRDTDFPSAANIASVSSKNIQGQQLKQSTATTTHFVSGNSVLSAEEDSATQNAAVIRSVTQLHTTKQASSVSDADGQVLHANQDARQNAATASDNAVSTSSDSSDASDSLVGSTITTSADTGPSSAISSGTIGKENTVKESQATSSVQAHQHASTVAESQWNETGSAAANILPVVHENTSKPLAEMETGSAKQSRSTVDESFAALDAGTPTWTHASARRAEVGFHDPTLGWIGVQAETSSSGVHAVLVPSSTEAAQTLSSHMEGLSAYLTEHHASVGTLSIADPSLSSTDSSMNQGAGQHSNQNAGKDAQAGSTLYASDPVITHATTGIEKQEAVLPVTTGGGAYISVMA